MARNLHITDRVKRFGRLATVINVYSPRRGLRGEEIQIRYDDTNENAIVAPHSLKRIRKPARS